MESIQTYLNSKNADYYYYSSASDCEYILPLIEIPDGFYIYLSVVNCLIPFSFYNINESNNSLDYTFDEIIKYNLYSINNIISYLNSYLLNGFSVTFNSLQNKITFNNTKILNF